MHKMKIIILMFIVTMTLFPLTSCSFFGSVFSKIIGETAEEIGARRLDEIMVAIENQDRDAIKSMFSEEALEKADDIDKGIDYLFALVEGKYESYEKRGSSEDKDVRGGKVTSKWHRFNYNVITDKEVYYMSILDYEIDNNNPKNIGLYSIKLFKASEEEELFQKPGIYFPTE